MVIKIAVFEALGKVNRYMKSFAPSLGRSVCSPARVQLAAVFPPVVLAALTQRATSG